MLYYFDKIYKYFMTWITINRLNFGEMRLSYKRKQVMESLLILWRKSPNQDLLKVAALSFFIFLVAELIAALVSGSLSLLADAIAM